MSTQYQAANESVMNVPDGDAFASELTYSTDSLLPTEAPVDSWRYRYVKRAVDILCSLILTVLFAVPGLLIAALVVATSPGPVFYRERRIGQNGRLFRIWKFRSMYRDAAQRAHVAHLQSGAKVIEWRMHKQLRDPRITTVGGFLRSWSLDELPQLLNVLTGDMSLIGPRPIVNTEKAIYGKLISVYTTAVPGLSGLWQVSGRSRISYDERAKMDAQYIQSWTMASDIVIFFRTFPAVLSRIGAH